ncbi:MAG: YgfZ/GcvT domain-containing protein [Solirubrobacterales bacterium]
MTAPAPDPSETQALSSGAALVDRSYLGRLALSGPQAREALGALATNDIEGLQPGTGCFAACCTAKGRMLGEIRVLYTGDELLLDMERESLQPVFDLVRHGLVGYEAELHKRTLETAQFSLLGPLSREVAGATGLGEAECDNAPGELGGSEVLLAATNLGVDVICGAADAEAVREALEAAGAVPAGMELAELARVESGRPRYGVDLDETVIPQEAGLNERLVNFEKGCYIGQETIARLHYRGRPNRRLCLLAVDAGAAPGDELTFDGRAVGTLTSVADSPERGPIGLALVRREAPDGSSLAIARTGGEAEILGPAGS